MTDRMTQERDDARRETDLVRGEARKCFDAAERADRFEGWLRSIGQISGCDHIDERLPMCIRDHVAALERERDEAESRYNGLHVANRALIDAIAVLERRNAALIEAVEAATKLCRCRGTGFYATDCTLCGDSTYDHICNDRRVACTRTECVSARAALARAEAAVKGDKE